jgi:hypothetical protein
VTLPQLSQGFHHLLLPTPLTSLGALEPTLRSRMDLANELFFQMHHWTFGSRSTPLSRMIEERKRDIHINVSRPVRMPDGTLKWPSTAWSSWAENMSKLSALIDDAEALIASESARCYLHIKIEMDRQVSELRENLEKQRERFTALLRLTKDYADLVLLDVSEEIQQQSSLLDSLERRLDMAKTLREEVVQLRKSYDVGTLDPIRKLRRTGV